MWVLVKNSANEFKVVKSKHLKDETVILEHRDKILLKDLRDQLRGKVKLAVAIVPLDFKEKDVNKKQSQKYQKKTYPCKQNYCLFCKELKTNIARHLMIKHADKEEVRKILSLPKANATRFNMLADLRKRGNFEFNKRNNEEPILVRRTYKLEKPDPANYVPCPVCKGYYSSTTLSRHYSYCGQDATSKAASRSVLNTAYGIRQEPEIHPLACKQLREKILPPMKRGVILDTIKKDTLLIMFGNHLIPKYRDHQEYIIRQKLRYLSKYFLTVKNKCPEIDTFQKLFVPKYFDLAIDCIKDVAEVDSTSNKYANPTYALSMTQNLKICCSILQSYYIREDDQEKERAVKRFSKLLSTESAGKINKPAHRDLCETKRKQMMTKKSMIPTTSDIDKFKHYLNKEARRTYDSLNNDGFSFLKWKTLAELCLIFIAVYNRKRSGEVQRILVDDFKSIKCLSDTALPEVVTKLSCEEKEEATRTFKLFIKGKLHRTVPVIIPLNIKIYLTYIVQHRQLAGISDDNPYLFGQPGMLSGKRYKHLDTCVTMRKYTVRAGLKNPSTIRTTMLRKHFATKTSTLNLEDARRGEVIKFMGHHPLIHDEYYNQQLVTKDLMIKKLLDQNSDNNANVQNNNTPGENAHTEEILQKRCNLGPIPEELENQRNENELIYENIETEELVQDDMEQCVDSNTFLNLVDFQPNDTVVIEREPDLNYKLKDQCVNEINSNQATCSGYSQARENVEIQSYQAPYSDEDRNNLEKKDNSLMVTNNKRLRPKTKKVGSAVHQDEEESEKDPFSDTDSIKDPEFKCSDAEDNDDNIPVTPPKKIPEKRTWLTPERHCARRLFKSNLDKRTVPTYNECSWAIKKNTELAARTPAQLRAWIAHEIKTRSSATEGVVPGRKRWATPEKMKVRSIFGEYINCRRYPATSEIEEVIERESVLRGRTVASIKSFLQHEMRKLF